jgi:hypothetical protein
MGCSRTAEWERLGALRNKNAWVTEVAAAVAEGPVLLSVLGALLTPAARACVPNGGLQAALAARPEFVVSAEGHGRAVVSAAGVEVDCRDPIGESGSALMTVTGLPYWTGVDDLRTLLDGTAGAEMADISIARTRQGLHAGYATIGVPTKHTEALRAALHGRTVGSRYIEVSVREATVSTESVSRADLENEVRSVLRRAGGSMPLSALGMAPRVRHGVRSGPCETPSRLKDLVLAMPDVEVRGPSGREVVHFRSRGAASDSVACVGLCALPAEVQIVRLRGLPFSASAADVRDLLAAHGLQPENVTIPRQPGGRSSGIALVDFGTPVPALMVEPLHLARLGGRYLELLPANSR